MNRKLFILMNVMTISVALHGMEIKLKGLTRSRTVNQDSQSRRQEGADNAQDFKLNMDNIPEPLFSSANGKQSVKTLNHVSHLKNQQITYRETTARGSSGGSPISGLRTRNNNNLIVQNDDEQKDEILDNNNIRQRGIDDSLNSYFSEQDMWDLLKKSNPRMHAYAIENNLLIGDVKNCPYNLETIAPEIYTLLNQLAKKKPLSLDQMMEYAHLLDSFDIGPEAVGELLQKQHNLSSDDIKLVVQKLGSIQKNNKEQYLGLALDFLSRTLDEGGIKEPSPIHAAHVAIQNDAIAQEKQQKLYSLIALGLTLATTLAGYAWAIYGQVSGTNTNAPTNSPTNAPTMFPTATPI
jgi:hypothetical protein